MIPGPFTYLVPQTLHEAIRLLDEHADDGKILAGGQSLIPIMKFRLAEPGCLIDINHISGLDSIGEQDGYLAIGALTREYELDRSALIKHRYPIIADTAEMVADPLVRNLATIGGNRRRIRQRMDAVGYPLDVEANEEQQDRKSVV